MGAEWKRRFRTWKSSSIFRFHSFNFGNCTLHVLNQHCWLEYSPFLIGSIHLHSISGAPIFQPSLCDRWSKAIRSYWHGGVGAAREAVKPGRWDGETLHGEKNCGEWFFLPLKGYKIQWNQGETKVSNDFFRKVLVFVWWMIVGFFFPEFSCSFSNNFYMTFCFTKFFFRDKLVCSNKALWGVKCNWSWLLENKAEYVFGDTKNSVLSTSMTSTNDVCLGMINLREPKWKVTCQAPHLWFPIKKKIFPVTWDSFEYPKAIVLE